MHFSVLELPGVVASLDLLPCWRARAEIDGKQKTEIFGQNFPQTSVKSSSYLQRLSPRCPRQTTEFICESEIMTPLHLAA